MELVEALPADGVAVLNADDERVAAMSSRTRASVVTYGSRGEVRMSDLRLDELARPRCRVESPWGTVDLSLTVSGAHMAANAAAALAVAGIVEGAIDEAAAALSDARLSPMRMEVRRSAGGGVVINDAYNANPDSMRAAFDALAGMSARRRIAVLGLMGEIDDPIAEHVRILDDARSRGIEVIAFGTDLYGIPWLDDPADVATMLEPIEAGDVVLVKASRAAGLERVAATLLGEPA